VGDMGGNDGGLLYPRSGGNRGGIQNVIREKNAAPAMTDRLRKNGTWENKGKRDYEGVEEGKILQKGATASLALQG